MPKAKKGTVAIQSIKERLRLCWSYDGKRYFMSLGLPDSKINRAAAALVANRIEEDIRTQNFDATLLKYRVSSHGAGAGLKATDLFQRFYKFKLPALKRQTQQKYQALGNQVGEFFGEAAGDVSVKDAIAFLAWLQTRMELVTVRDRVSILKACWDWGISQNLASFNPWNDARNSLKKVSRKKPNPFTEEEVKRILAEFQTDPGLEFYRDFVEFRLRTGARTGEIVGLCWKHLSDDCSTIQISESVTKGVRDTTKTGEERGFVLSPILQQMLLQRRPNRCQPDDLVFPSPKGKVIDANNFARRVWKPVLERLEIPYRKPYNTRSTFASHALEKGATPGEVTEITGHSQDVLFKHYAGAIKKSQLPDLW